MSNIQKLRLDAINILAGTQSRAATNDDTVKEYTEALDQGAEFPPVVVFSDGSDTGKWLADGFHRYLAHRKAGVQEIACDVRIGTLRDAKLFSNGANGTHGLPRTNADKNRAVMNMLADDEWKTWSQEQIAKACRVSTGLVSKIINKASLHGEEMKPTTRTVTRNGVTYEQNTANFGKSAAPAVAQPPETTVEPRSTPHSDSAAAAPTPSTPMPRDDVSAPSPVEITTPANEDGTVAGPKLIQVDEEVYHELIRNFEETLAANEMMSRVFDADDRLKAAMDEAARQRAIAESAEQSVAQKSSEYKARADAVTYWQGQAKKEKARADRAEKELAQLRAAA